MMKEGDNFFHVELLNEQQKQIKELDRHTLDLLEEQLPVEQKLQGYDLEIDSE